MYIPFIFTFLFHFYQLHQLETHIISDCRKDILVLLDSSISISEIYFKPVREFLIDLIKKLKIGPDGAHLGLITFSSKEKTRRLLDVGQIQSQSKLIEWLKERNYTTELKRYYQNRSCVEDRKRSKSFKITKKMFLQLQDWECKFIECA